MLATERLEILRDQQCWITREGQRISLGDMAVSHLRNSLALIRRLAWQGELASLDMDAHLSDKDWYMPGEGFGEVAAYMEIAVILAEEIVERQTQSRKEGAQGNALGAKE